MNIFSKIDHKFPRCRVVKSHPLIYGSILLTVTGLFTRFTMVFYRIFLNHAFGEEALGLYQLILPLSALGFSLTSSGIQDILSKYVSESLALGQKKKAVEYLYTALILTLSFSFILLFLLQHCAPIIAQEIFHDERCEVLLLLLSYVFPFMAVHATVTGYYFGCKNTLIPSSSIVFEQFVRICSVLFLFLVGRYFHFYFGILLAVLGELLGEIASSGYSLYKIHQTADGHAQIPLTLRSFVSCSRDLLALSIPLSLNHLLLNIMQSIEAISIPSRLQASGLDASTALGIYGTLTGLVLPCILFPTAITASISTLLLPTVAELQASGKESSLLHTISKTIYLLIILGCIFCVFFLMTGRQIAHFLSADKTAEQMISLLAWLCPFLYTTSAMNSIIHGLGKTGISFLFNIISHSIRLICVFCLIPTTGLNGYFTGLFFSQILMFLFCITYLYSLFKRTKHADRSH